MKIDFKNVKDLLTVRNDGGYLGRRYEEFYEKYGYVPEMFCPYSCSEVADYAPTLTGESNTAFGHSGTVLIIEIERS